MASRKIPIIHIDETTTKIDYQQSTRTLHVNQVSNVLKVVNIIYGLVCCLLSLVLITTEPFKACGLCGGELKLAILSFLIYMYYVSIIWLCGMAISISIAKRTNKISIKNNYGINRRLSHFIRSKENLFNKKLYELHNLIDTKRSNRRGSLTRTNTANNLNVPIDVESSNIQLNSSKSVANFNSEDQLDLDINSFQYTYDYNNGTGELYIRVGTGILSLCTMIDIGLNLVRLLESYSNKSRLANECKATFIMSVITEFGAFIFTFVQCFFIFKYANIVINHGKNIASIGLCHLVCTNFCVTLRTIVHETFNEIAHNGGVNKHETVAQHGKELLTTLLNATLNSHKPVHTHHTRGISFACTEEASLTTMGIIQDTKEKIAPYIYPCVIEYSLLCLTVFYIIWENLEKPLNTTVIKKLYESRKSSQLSSCDRLNVLPKSYRKYAEQHRHSISEHLRVNSFTIDCGKSASGLFVGLFILLVTIISLIVYFIYKTERQYISIQLSEVTEILLVCLSLAVCLAAFFKLKRFGYMETHSHSSYNETLTIMALAGVYLFSFFSIIAILAQGIETVTVGLALVIHILCLIEGTLQSAFILDGLRRCAKDLKSKKEKPARSLITILIMINLSLWLSETFSVKKYDMNTVQLDYYNIIFWSIVSSIATPLAIFFRFHSSVCLSDIWKTLYQ